ncbi:hypothetical protein Cpap_0863 [Ruminiclostridium papyrosolvens DSM 2782]|uniref:Uncharacterized protein n=1 Tax=Ruminiclostridium papyrosolvens DSM 2782 TaxID=588581 RepID=F1TH11_9FIRM|nr:hypothetical protein [Ruminiclostridium papyrosolvens]EGD46251.1 hypothetical protein Cpap_0863 [Ruminiclostridium papyrosolvens DSM 2782]WES33026.1 hypothetical protein P0092_14820 [Ruminiclostridium papyrosolvens DSM 2782]
MNKIFVSMIIIPFIALLMFKGIAISDYDLKQRYLKDQVDLIAYQIKITGRLTAEAYNEFKTKISKIADFSSVGSSIILKKGVYAGGRIVVLTNYTIGEKLNKGEAFMVYIKSGSISMYSRLQNGGISADDSKNLYYKARAECRIEVYSEQGNT